MYNIKTTNAKHDVIKQSSNQRNNVCIMMIKVYATITVQVNKFNLIAN